MTTFYKVEYELSPSYLSDHLPERSVNITTPFSRIEMYGNSFFPYCIENWNKLDNSVKILPLTCFKNHLNSFIRPKGKRFYGINDNSGMKLSKIKVQFSDLRDHRYTHNFNCKSPFCSCGLEYETTVHYFLSRGGGVLRFAPMVTCATKKTRERG